MSCGDHHETPCEDVLDEVYFYLDQEPGTLDVALIRHHLDECAPCLRKYGLEQAVKALIARSCAERAPQELRQKVLLKIQQVRIEIEQVEFTTE